MSWVLQDTQRREQTTGLCSAFAGVVPQQAGLASQQWHRFPIRSTKKVPENIFSGTSQKLTCSCDASP